MRRRPSSEPRIVTLRSYSVHTSQVHYLVETRKYKQGRENAALPSERREYRGDGSSGSLTPPRLLPGGYVMPGSRQVPKMNWREVIHHEKAVCDIIYLCCARTISRCFFQRVHQVERLYGLYDAEAAPYPSARARLPLLPRAPHPGAPVPRARGPLVHSVVLCV